MRNKQMLVLGALRGFANKGGSSKFQVAKAIQGRVEEKVPGTKFQRSEVHVILEALREAGLVERQETKKTNPKGTRGRNPSFEFAISETGRNEYNQLLAVAK